MQITIDLNALNQLSHLGPLGFFWFIFKNGGWLILLITLVWGWLYGRLLWKRQEYLRSVQYDLLAIDIPKNNEQSLMAMEQFFAHLYGIKVSGTKWNRLWEGKVQLAISLEIVSLEGYIQFLIRTPKAFRDYVEAAVYAQYPEAEITEVEDYINLIPEDVQSYKTDFNFWAAEMTLVKPSPYPIKTYALFEHQMTQKFADPLAALLETMSKLQTGEQIGFQLVIRPTSDAWKKEGESLVNNLMGIKSTATKHLGDNLIDTTLEKMEGFSESIISLWADVKPGKEREAPPSLLQYLSPGTKDEIENIQKKLLKVGYKAKLRVYYLAHNDVFLGGRGINALMGSFWQFRGYNGFKPIRSRMTNAEYFFKRIRKAKIAKKFLREYKRRDSKWGAIPMVLTTDELATIWHFPASLDVKTPLLKKTEARKSEPPTSLPLAQELGSSFKRSTPKPIEAEVPVEEVKPGDLVIKETLPGYDFANDYYEQKFAKKPATETAAAPDQPVIPKQPKEVEPPEDLPYV